jgi:diadenosine tetraphosphatase ApaH/serine/threonine PP2A family protein phosphatase
VKGNHEEKHERFRRHEYLLRTTGKKNPIKTAEQIREIHEQFSPEDVAFLDTAVLWHRLRGGEVVVHGGIPPRFDQLPFPFTHDLARDLRERSNELLRFRYGDETGHMIPLGEVPPETPFWAHSYDGRFGHVYFGHEPFIGETEPKRFPYASGIDLGCVFGGNLCAVVLSDDSESWVTVPAHEKYSTSYKEE